MATPGISQVLHTSETKLRGNAVAKEFAEYDGFFRNDKGLLSDESADKRKVRPGRILEAPGRPARLPLQHRAFRAALRTEKLHDHGEQLLRPGHRLLRVWLGRVLPFCLPLERRDLPRVYHPLGALCRAQAWPRARSAGRGTGRGTPRAVPGRVRLIPAGMGPDTLRDGVQDIGCGVGGPMRCIAKFSGASITGINNNEYQIRRGTKQNVEAGLDHLCSFLQVRLLHPTISSCSAAGNDSILPHSVPATSPLDRATL